MFDSGVKEGELAVHQDGRQRNGPVLGNDGAVFLTEFLAKLQAQYAAFCAE